MNKKILTYALAALLGVSTANADKMTIIGIDKTPAKEKSSIESKKPSQASTLEKAVGGDQTIVTFYLDNKDDQNTINAVYNKAKDVSGKKIDKERFSNWVKTSIEDKNQSATLKYSKDRGIYFEGTDNYFNTSNSKDIANGAQTQNAKRAPAQPQTIEEIVETPAVEHTAYSARKTPANYSARRNLPSSKRKAQPASETERTNDFTIGLGAENGNAPVIGGALRIFDRFWINGQFYNETDPQIENTETKSGTRFNAVGITRENTKKDITSYGIDYHVPIPIARGFGLTIGGEHRIISAETEKSIEERLQSKNGVNYGSNTDIYVNSDKTEDNGAKIGIEYSNNWLNIKGYSVFGGKETRAGVSIGYAFSGNHNKPRSNLPNKK